MSRKIFTKKIKKQGNPLSVYRQKSRISTTKCKSIANGIVVVNVFLLVL